MKKNRDVKLEKIYMQQGGFTLVGIILLAVKRIFLLILRCRPVFFTNWTGYYCPGCGGTRAVKALLRGDVIGSFFYHPVVLYGAVLYGWYMLSHTVEYLSKGRLRISIPYTEKYLYGAVFIILIQWILKNGVKIIWGIDLI